MALFWTTAGLKGRGRKPVLALLTDNSPQDPLPAVRRLPPGSLVVLRFLKGEALPGYVPGLRRLCRERRLKFLVSSDWRLAERLGADGLHLPEALASSGQLAPCLGWMRRKPHLLLTAAAHSAKALARAAAMGADAALLSPVFTTQSHAGTKPLGPLRFARLCRFARIPVLALAGVNRRTARYLAASGATGFAGVSGI
ncbi:MAG: thiamine phosphate synthase [Rhodospirillales bacterium]|nr:MAG: thiamine phosphate synthase [Rhodospirillales bacterium]